MLVISCFGKKADISFDFRFSCSQLNLKSKLSSMCLFKPTVKTQSDNIFFQ